MNKRYIVELGTGVDMHGGDSTKAACRAVRDAVSHCCLCGISEILGGPAIRLAVKVAVPDPDRVYRSAVLGQLPSGGENAVLEVASGGMTAAGLHVDELGEGSGIVIANASITVFVDAGEGGRL